MILVDLWQRSLYLADHYSDWGLLPRGPLISQFLDKEAVSFHLFNGSVVFVGIMFALAAAAAVGLIIGWKTKLMTIVSWALLVSLHHRNPIILQSGDFLIRCILFWLIFVQTGSCYSVDAALRRHRQSKHQFTFPGVILMLQVALMYLFAASLKNSPIWWPEGTATYYTLQLDQYTTSFGSWLGQFFQLNKILTFSVLLMEWLAAPLLLAPLFFGIKLGRLVRLITIFILVGIHLGFAASLYIGLFPWIDLVSLLIFLPTFFWDRICYYLRRKDMPKLIYEGGCLFCEKLIRILAEFFI